MTGELGGTWRNRGRGPHALVGLGTAGAGFDRGSPYRREPDSHDPRVAFIFEGIDGELIGDEPNLQVRWGAAGYEFDRVDVELGSPASHAPPRVVGPIQRLAQVDGRRRDVLHAGSRRRPRRRSAGPGHAAPVRPGGHGLPRVPERRRGLLGRLDLLARQPVRPRLRRDGVAGHGERPAPVRRPGLATTRGVTRIEVVDASTVWQADPDDPAGPRLRTAGHAAGVRRDRAQPPRRHDARGRRRPATPGPERRRRRDLAAAGQPVRGRVAGAAGTSAGARSRSWRTAACSRSSSPSTRRPAGPPYNPVTEGLVPVRNLVARSDDGGATWSEPWELADGRHVQHASQGLLALPDGGAPVHVRDVQDLRRPGRLALHRRAPPLRRRRPHLGHRRSSSAASDPDGDPHDTMWWDPRIARLASGELVQCYYAFRHATRTEGPVHIAWSPDDGATWSAPASTGLPGQATYPLPARRRAAASSSSNAAPRPRRWSRSSPTTAAGPSIRRSET